MQLQYATFIKKTEYGDYRATFPDFPGCVIAGNSIDEAVWRAKDALCFHIEGMLADRNTLPRPSELPPAGELAGIIVVFLSFKLPVFKRVNITLNERLLDMIDRKSAKRGISLSAFLAQAARKFLKDEK